MIPHVMSYEKAVKLGLVQTYSKKLYPMPANIWSPQLTDEQRKEMQKQIDDAS